MQKFCFAALLELFLKTLKRKLKKDAKKKTKESLDRQPEEQQKFRNFFVRGFGKVRAVDDGREDCSVLIRWIRFSTYLKKAEDHSARKKNNNTQT